MVKTPLEQFKSDLRCVLIASGKKGVRLKYIGKEFYELHDETIPFKDLGFRNLVELLKICKDACRFGADAENPGEYLLHMVADANTAHMKNLQDKTPIQRKKKKRYGFNPQRRVKYPTYSARTQVPSARPQFKPTGYSANPKGFVPKPFSGFARPTAPAPKSSTYQPGNIVKPKSTAPILSSKPSTKKVCSAGWEVYGGYVASLIKPRKFGALKGDVERMYITKFKEALPTNWVDQLENRFIIVDKVFANGSVSVKLKEDIKPATSAPDTPAVVVPAVKLVPSVKPEVIVNSGPKGVKSVHRPGSNGDEGIEVTSPAKDVIDQTSPTKKVHVIDLVSPSVMSTNITIDLTTPPSYSRTSLEDQMIKLKLGSSSSPILVSDSDSADSSDWSSCEEEVEDLLLNSIIDKDKVLIRSSKLSAKGTPAPSISSSRVPRTDLRVPSQSARVPPTAIHHGLCSTNIIPPPANPPPSPRSLKVLQPSLVPNHKYLTRVRTGPAYVAPIPTAMPASNNPPPQPPISATPPTYPNVLPTNGTSTTLPARTTINSTPKTSAAPAYTTPHNSKVSQQLGSQSVTQRSLQRNLQKPRRILSSTPAAARLRNKNSEERFYKPPGSGGFSPLGSPNLFNNRLRARASPSVGISLLDILDGSSLGVEPVQDVSSVPLRAGPIQVAQPGPQLDTSNTNSRIDDDDYVIFNSDDSDFGSAESESTEADGSKLLDKLDGYNCICRRPRGLTYCKDCGNIVPGSRVKMTCQAHPKMFLTCDLLICPKCKSSTIIEVSANN